MKQHPHILLITLVLFLTACSVTKNNLVEKNRPVFSKKLGFELDKKYDYVLVKEVTNWLGVPYKYGGNSKEGTDCSGFVQQVYGVVYKIKTARSANGIFEESTKVSKHQLKQGQLVFFKINTENVGHVGIFLQESWFIHASSSKGVMVSSLETDYWKKYFVAGGKLNL